MFSIETGMTPVPAILGEAWDVLGEMRGGCGSSVEAKG